MSALFEIYKASFNLIGESIFLDMNEISLTDCEQTILKNLKLAHEKMTKLNIKYEAAFYSGNAFVEKNEDLKRQNSFLVESNKNLRDKISGMKEEKAGSRIHKQLSLEEMPQNKKRRNQPFTSTKTTLDKSVKRRQTLNSCLTSIEVESMEENMSIKEWKNTPAYKAGVTGDINHFVESSL